MQLTDVTISRSHVGIFDNIDADLLPELRRHLEASKRADFCVGYFNLRGWQSVADLVERYDGESEVCRVLVGMHCSESEEVRNALARDGRKPTTKRAAKQLKRKLAKEFRKQLQWGRPSNRTEQTLRRLARQLRSGRVRVALFAPYQLHAKLYLCYPETTGSASVGFVGSSNLTFAGLHGKGRYRQGELNVDLVEQPDCDRLSAWFEERWDDPHCYDISEDLADIIDESWARTDTIDPYHIYLKIAWHLAYDARIGQNEFSLPAEMKGVLFDYQTAAVKLAARHLKERGGVIIGDVVGLGKTLMATALALINDHLETLIIAPKNLVGMWEEHMHRYGLRRTKVISITRVQNDLPELRRYRLLVIDESHNLRNREGKRYRVIKDYIDRNDAMCVLLTATPYNKTYLDLSSQLRLFLDDTKDLGIRPEKYLAEIGESEFARRVNAPERSIAAFEASNDADDWRDLMRLYLVRRTRSFIKANYAFCDCRGCGTAIEASAGACPECNRKVTSSLRRYLEYPGGGRSYFPARIPKNLAFKTEDPDDPYARLYDESVVATINKLKLPRYGLAEYFRPNPKVSPTVEEQQIMEDLGRARIRLRGFCRTNLFKRLESSGEAFLFSIERHALRNLVVAHALAEGKPVPVGSQDAALLDPDFDDEDRDELFADDEDATEPMTDRGTALADQAATLYELYTGRYAHRFRFLRSEHFRPALRKDLLRDAEALIELLEEAGEWKAKQDAKFQRLLELVTKDHPKEKILLFSQFADTIRYLDRALQEAGVEGVAAVTGDTDNPTDLAGRFSPTSNGKQVDPAKEIRVLMATDVLSEGQNLQDAHIVVNFDLPWALIRLVQRAGRVDRIGQKAERILCYSFMPAEGVEKIIRLRERVSQRIEENAEVVGSDERFFEGTSARTQLVDIYNEKVGVLDDDEEGEVDLASRALSIWQSAVRRDPSVQAVVESLPGVVYSTKKVDPEDPVGEGVLAYVRTASSIDALVRLDGKGNVVSESPIAILKAAECEPETPALERREDHHQLVDSAVEEVDRESTALDGKLGNKRSARYRCYVRLDEIARSTPLFADRVAEAREAIYRNPLTESAENTIRRQLREGIDDDDLCELVAALHEEDQLVAAHDTHRRQEAEIICSLGLR